MPAIIFEIDEVRVGDELGDVVEVSVVIEVVGVREDGEVVDVGEDGEDGKVGEIEEVLSIILITVFIYPRNHSLADKHCKLVDVF